MDMQSTRKFLSRTQAARVLGRCPKILRNLQNLGRGPTVIMVGDRPAYLLADLQQWLADNTYGDAS